MIGLPNGLSLKLAAGIVAALLFALLIHDRNHWKTRAEHVSELLSAEKSAHAATVANYRAAAEQARREDAQALARVKAEQAAINERTENDYESRIAAARAAAERLRQRAQAAAADPRAGRAAPVRAISTAAAGAAESAGQYGLSPDDKLIATEQAIQLDELIRWVRAQAAVDPNSASRN